MKPANPRYFKLQFELRLLLQITIELQKNELF